MFEPAYLPQLSPLLPSYIGASFGINHFRRLRLPEDPDIDPIHTHPYWDLHLRQTHWPHLYLHALPAGKTD